MQVCYVGFGSKATVASWMGLGRSASLSGHPQPHVWGRLRTEKGCYQAQCHAYGAKPSSNPAWRLCFAAFGPIREERRRTEALTSYSLV